MPKSKNTSDPNRLKKITEFLWLGFNDYIGARVLLMNRLSLQGAILASTAVEKYIKALLSVRGEILNTHLKSSHITSLKNYIPQLYKKLNPEFLNFLQHCYSLRYTDQLPINYSIVIYARETMAELDYTINNLEFQFNFKQSGGQESLTHYRSALKDKDERLLKDNYILLNHIKSEHLKHEDYAFTLRKTPELGLMSTDFVSFESPQDGNFMREGLQRLQ